MGASLSSLSEAKERKKAEKAKKVPSLRQKKKKKKNPFPFSHSTTACGLCCCAGGSLAGSRLCISISSIGVCGKWTRVRTRASIPVYTGAAEPVSHTTRSQPLCAHACLRNIFAHRIRA